MPGPKYVKDFEFPSNFGFTGSAGQVAVRPHARQAPQRFAEGGQVKRITGAQVTEEEAKRIEKMKPPPPTGAQSTPGEEKRYSLKDVLKGKSRQQQEKDLGLKKGGKVRKAMGGPVKASKGGRTFKPEKGETMAHERGESAAMERMEHRMGEKAAHKKGYARGGYAKGGMVGCENAMDQKLAKHIRAPKPRGHGVK